MILKVIQYVLVSRIYLEVETHNLLALLSLMTIHVVQHSMLG